MRKRSTIGICDCDKYSDLELTAKSIYVRLKETRAIKPNLKLLAGNKELSHKLMLCENCRQYWQISLARLWNNVEYGFKVPEILPEAWLEEPFLSPDEMAVRTKAVDDFIKAQDLSERDLECIAEGCSKRALTLTVMCLGHHYEWCHRKVKKSIGRIFPPYLYLAEEFRFIKQT